MLSKWEDYEKKLFTMGNTRNSFSKTDPDATFMHMKEAHMRNGQLKPGYNVQIAVNSEYITGVAAFSNRTDSGTMQPFLKWLQQRHGQKYRDVVADAGYESLDNYLYLEESGQISFIKPINYETQKTSSTELMALSVSSILVVIFFETVRVLNNFEPLTSIFNMKMGLLLATAPCL